MKTHRMKKGKPKLSAAIEFFAIFCFQRQTYRSAAATATKPKRYPKRIKRFQNYVHIRMFNRLFTAGR